MNSSPTLPQQEAPEDSVPLRAVVFAMAVLCVVASSVFTKSAWWLTALYLLLICAGSYLSYRYRYEDPRWMHYIWWVGILLVGANAMQEFTGPLRDEFDMVSPFVHFICGIFAFVTFSMRTRTDLNTATGLGLILICLSGPVATGVPYGACIFGYLALGAMMMYFDCISRTLTAWLQSKITAAPEIPIYNKRKGLPRGNTIVLLIVVPLLAVAMFLYLPRADETLDKIWAYGKTARLEYLTDMFYQAALAPPPPKSEEPKQHTAREWFLKNNPKQLPMTGKYATKPKSKEEIEKEKKKKEEEAKAKPQVEPPKKDKQEKKKPEKKEDKKTEKKEPEKTPKTPKSIATSESEVEKPKKPKVDPAKTEKAPKLDPKTTEDASKAEQQLPPPAVAEDLKKGQKKEAGLTPDEKNKDAKSKAGKGGKDGGKEGGEKQAKTKKKDKGPGAGAGAGAGKEGTAGGGGPKGGAGGGGADGDTPAEEPVIAADDVLKMADKHKKDERLVFTVKSRRLVYLRRQAYDFYDGKTWTRSIEKYKDGSKSAGKSKGKSNGTGKDGAGRAKKSKGAKGSGASAETVLASDDAASDSDSDSVADSGSGDSSVSGSSSSASSSSSTSASSGSSASSASSASSGPSASSGASSSSKISGKKSSSSQKSSSAGKSKSGSSDLSDDSYSGVDEGTESSGLNSAKPQGRKVKDAKAGRDKSAKTAGGKTSKDKNKVSGKGARGKDLKGKDKDSKKSDADTKEITLFEEKAPGRVRVVDGEIKKDPPKPVPAPKTVVRAPTSPQYNPAASGGVIRGSQPSVFGYTGQNGVIRGSQPSVFGNTGQNGVIRGSQPSVFGNTDPNAKPAETASQPVRVEAEKLKEQQAQQAEAEPEAKDDKVRPFFFESTDRPLFRVGMADALKTESSLPTVELVQEIKVKAKSIGNVVPAAWIPQEVKLQKGLTKVGVDDLGVITCAKPILKDAEIKVKTELPMYPIQAMKQELPLSAKEEDAIRTKYKQFLQLPETVNEGLFKLAEDNSDPRFNWFVQSQQICDYLRDNFEYDGERQVNPEAPDMVQDFLFETGKGTDADFASAFVLLTRCVGIPSRIVYGFAPGDHNPITGEQEVRMKHKLVWAEAFIPNFGWVPFDAHPDGVLPAQQRENRYTQKEVEKTLGLDAILAKIKWTEVASYVVAGLLSLIVGFVVFKALLEALRKWRQSMVGRGPEWKLYRKVTKAVKKSMKITRNPEETPTEFLERVASVVNERKSQGKVAPEALPDALNTFLKTYSAVYFGMHKEELEHLKYHAEQVVKVTKSVKMTDIAAATAKTAVRRKDSEKEESAASSAVRRKK